MESSKELLARRKVLAFGVDTLVIIKVVLVAYESRGMSDVVNVLDKRRTNVLSGSGWGTELLSVHGEHSSDQRE